MFLVFSLSLRSSQAKSLIFGIHLDSRTHRTALLGLIWRNWYYRSGKQSIYVAPIWSAMSLYSEINGGRELRKSCSSRNSRNSLYAALIMGIQKWSIRFTTCLRE
jgi:hypothetical protein